MDTTVENVEAFVAARYSNPSFKAVDVAMPDSNDFCFCETCLEMFIDNGYANSAAVVYFANRLSEDMNEKYPGLVYQIFAYNDTNKPPTKIVPNRATTPAPGAARPKAMPITRPAAMRRIKGAFR